MPRFVADIVDALAHETFDRVHGPVRLGEQPPLRLAPDVHGAVGCHRHHGRHQPIAGAIANDERNAVLHERDEAVGGPEIDADDFAHPSSSR